jgi:hypothetical protein
MVVERVEKAQGNAGLDNQAKQKGKGSKSVGRVIHLKWASSRG